jgi:putative hydrolase of the HAD superfamily
VRAVLFDAAGTLIHLSEPVGEIYARFARRFGGDVSPARLQVAFGERFRSMPPMVFAGVPMKRIEELEREWWRSLVDAVLRSARARDEIADFDRFFGELFEHFAQAATWRAAAGAAEALSVLRRRGFSTGVVSNFDRRLLAILDGLGLAPLLDVVVLPSEAGAAKPSPLIFQLALERLGVTAGQALYIGNDAEHDVEGAKRAGLASLDVRQLQGLAELPSRIPPSSTPAAR